MEFIGLNASPFDRYLDSGRFKGAGTKYPPGVIAEVESPNELNNKFPPQELNLHYKGKTDEAAGAAYMDDYYMAIKADPVTASIPVWPGGPRP